ncbi:unnamed protein product [Prorocentrum cordatum]|uniref:Uncharacterized protein n=1 Tax=Prorocentrum cordatum TaxID=2364126 RepID=A0ABN9SKM9_9DINO|nr:unnamed protein product [Polarella glacialis]
MQRSSTASPPKCLALLPQGAGGCELAGCLLHTKNVLYRGAVQLQKRAFGDYAPQCEALRGSHFAALAERESGREEVGGVQVRGLASTRWANRVVDPRTCASTDVTCEAYHSLVGSHISTWPSGQGPGGKQRNSHGETQTAWQRIDKCHTPGAALTSAGRHGQD